MNKDPVFVAYALTVVVNSLNLMVLWTLSGAARFRSKSTQNPEDARSFARGAAVVAHEPDAVARVLRVHRNSFDNTLPFLVLGLVFVLLRPPALEAQILFATFTAGRLGFSVAYMNALQPWRSICYGVGALTTLALMVEVVRLSLA